MSSIPEIRNPNARRNTYDALPAVDYEARITRVIGLGVHPQDPYTDPKTKEVRIKAPAFRMDLVFELIGTDTSGKDADGKPLEPKPACQFKSYPVNPKAKNSGMLTLVKMIDPSVETLKGDLQWYKDMLLNKVVSITLKQYTNKAGEVKNGIQAINPIPTKYRAAVGEARTDLVFFEPYTENDENTASYALMYPYQRNLLTQANDAANIPLAGREIVSAKETEQREPAPTVPTVDKEPASTVDFDDDIPF